MAKPRKTGRNQIIWKVGENFTVSSTSISNVCCPLVQYITNAPIRDTTEPMNRYRVSFMAAYSRVLIQPQMAIRRYIGKTAIS